MIVNLNYDLIDHIDISFYYKILTLKNEIDKKFKKLR